MPHIFDTEDDSAAIRKEVKASLRLWIRRSAYAAAALILSCLSVVPFSLGHSLHIHAEPFGRLLVYLSIGLLTVFTICICMAVSSYTDLRKLKKIES